MLALPPSGLAIRQAERLPSEGPTKLPNISESFGPGGALDIHTVGRLPSICDLLRDVLPPPTKSQYHPTFSPSPRLSPIGSFPSSFCAPYPTWPALRPRSQSVSGQFPGHLAPPQPLAPRRASASCIGFTAPSYSVPGQTSSHHHHHHHHHHQQQQQQHRANPDRDHSRQRRSSKQALRRRSAASPSPSYPSSTSSSSDSEPATPRSTTNDNNNNSNSNKEEEGRPSKREKRNNAPYTFEQEAFTIYHRIDLDLPWEQVRAAYMARWPGLKRSVSGLECAYYRTNKYLPAVTPGDGLLVLVDVEGGEAGETTDGLNGAGYHPSSSSSSMSDVSAENAGRGDGWGWQQQQQQFGYEEGGSVAEDSEGGGEKGEKHVWYKYYKGVAYRTRQVPCRRGRYSLMERFPEELVDEKNDWVREEHRVMARDIAERRRRQREEFLAARARQNHQGTFHL